MARPSPIALYYAFLALTLATILVAPYFSPTLWRMRLVIYSAFCGAVTFVLVTLYQGITAKLGIAPFRPKNWVLRLFRVQDDAPPHP